MKDYMAAWKESMLPLWLAWSRHVSSGHLWCSKACPDVDLPWPKQGALLRGLGATESILFHHSALSTSLSMLTGSHLQLKHEASALVFKSSAEPSLPAEGFLRTNKKKS